MLQLCQDQSYINMPTQYKCDFYDCKTDTDFQMTTCSIFLCAQNIDSGNSIEPPHSLR